MNTFAAEIEKRRQARGWSQEQLAAAATLSRSTVGHAEDGAPVSVRTIKALATALDWPVVDAIAASRVKVASITIRGDVAERLTSAAKSAGKAVEVYLAGLLPAGGKRKK